MRQPRLTAALLVSAILISTALWVRFSTRNPVLNNIVVVPGTERALSNEVPVENFYAASSTPLSQTDLVARQLFSDYIKLHSEGNSSTAVLDDLGAKYASGILNQSPSLSAKKVSQDQILTVPDSEENLYQYGQRMSAIRDKYTKMAEGQYSASGTLTKTGAQKFETFSGKAAELYTLSAEEILNVRVPVSLAANHLAIVNNYFESAAAMEAIANASQNPVNAYAAVNTQSTNAKKEGELFLNIQVALMANGVPLNHGL